ncbi:MAG: alpha/beta hydrolase [Ignavibacteriales bacterium]|nr:alpha/beta hydrolase [Ignavibacteriales bacterium]
MRKRSLIIIGLQFLPLLALHSQQEVRLWEGDAPGALGKTESDIPTLTAYVVDSATAPTAAMVIFPGGGYGHLAAHEGKDYALFLRSHGVAAFVVKYRLGTDGYRHPCMLQDAARALRLVRSCAQQWKIDPSKVGVMGSSAGGHLASTLLTHFDAGKSDNQDSVERQSSRPAIGVLCYAVISMGALGHSGSRKNLLGENPTAELICELSNELYVTKETPPCFLWHTGEDKSVNVANTLEFAAALQRNNVPYDLHIYQKGRHGIGLVDVAPFAHPHPWANDLLFWLEAQNFIVNFTTKK